METFLKLLRHFSLDEILKYAEAQYFVQQSFVFYKAQISLKKLNLASLDQTQPFFQKLDRRAR